MLQIHRLQNHPSILIWAGNNEVKLSIFQDWYYSMNYSKNSMFEDHKQIYDVFIQNIIKNLDPFRPYLATSPTNNVENRYKI